MPRIEKVALVLVPLVAVTTLAIGLRVGASPAVHAAVVYGAPPGAAKERLAWQLVTIVDDRDVRESVAMKGLTVIAQAKGREARWEGATNPDGVAEMALDLPGVEQGDLVHLEVRLEGERTPLAEGFATWPAVPPAREPRSALAFVRPSKQEGDLVIDVEVYGQRLVPGFPGTVSVRVVDRMTGTGVRGAHVFAEPDPGLTVGHDGQMTAEEPATTDDAGWVELRATPQIHVVALGLRAGMTEGTPPKRGSWFGALPVAPGGAYVVMPLTIAPGEPHEFEVTVPTVLPRVYVEVDDDLGRVTAAALPLIVDPAGSSARFDVGPLAVGTYWLVTSGEPRGAETLSGSAIARPFKVSPAEPVPWDIRALSRLVAPRFPRFVALDGLPGKRRTDGKRHRLGFALAFGSLTLAAAIEALLILRAVARSRREIARITLALDDGEAPIERRMSGIHVVIGLAIALLGFALLAALLTWKAS